MASIREKPHRLVKEFYRGSSIVAFTLCLKNRATIFKNPELVDIFIRFLKKTATKFKCKIPIYCFMPDHLHLIITGIDDEADLLKVVSILSKKLDFGCLKIW